MKIKYSIKPWDDIIRVGDWVYQPTPDWQKESKYRCYQVHSFSLKLGLNLLYTNFKGEKDTCEYNNREDFKKARPNQPNKYIYED